MVRARSSGGIAANFWYQMKEDELKFVTMEIIFDRWYHFNEKITALSGFLFIGMHCIYFIFKRLQMGKHNLQIVNINNLE